MVSWSKWKSDINVSNSAHSCGCGRWYGSNKLLLLLLTLSAHAHSEGYCSCRVCMCVCMYVCVYVCVTTHYNCRLTHWNHKTEIPTCSQQYSDRFKFSDFPKNASFKSYGVICLPRAAPAS